MKILLSPTKKMQEDLDSLSPRGLPACLSKSRQVLEALKAMDPQALQKLWGCNDAIAAQNVERISHMDLQTRLTPAILAYEGIAFQYMAPAVFTDRELSYVQDHLRILSALYGVLKPLDGIQSYRLEMQAPLKVGEYKNLYDFWGRTLYELCLDDSRILLNLASKEYYKCVEKYLQPEDRFISCSFCEEVNGKLKQKATFAKMARGEMVRFLAETQAEAPAEAKEFDRLDFHFRPELSSDTEYVFLRTPN